MAVFKILILFVAVQVVYSKPLLFKELEMKNKFEFSLKPFLKPITFIKEKWSPFGNFGVKHTIAKRSPFALPPVNPEPSPAPLFKVALEKSLDLISPVKPAVHPHTEAEIIKEASTHTAGLPPGHPKVHEEIHEERFQKPHPEESHAGKLHTKVDIQHSPELPHERHESNLLPHIGIPPVAPLIPAPHEGREEHLRELSKLPGNKEGPCPCPVHNPPSTQVIAANEHHLHELPKPKEIEHHIPTSALHPGIAGEETFLGLSKSSSVGIQQERVSPLPERINKLRPGIEHQGTLEGLLGPQVGIEEETVPFPVVPSQHAPVLPSGQGAFPGLLKPPPAEIQKSNEFPVSLFTDIARANDINAYLKAVDALPLIKPPLEENILQAVPGNSIEAVGSKDSAADNKADTSAIARGSRLALYFGNILLQVMSQAIGSARSAISQYSKPSTI